MSLDRRLLMRLEVAVHLGPGVVVVIGAQVHVFGRQYGQADDAKGTETRHRSRCDASHAVSISDDAQPGRLKNNSGKRQVPARPSDRAARGGTYASSPGEDWATRR